ncbi:MAG TPA: nucleotide exchange factor GrpE [Dehalococcoidia bacterium]|nr:nucleotide exchange factor GrpE [Dehalococcoidia bacterium]
MVDESDGKMTDRRASSRTGSDDSDNEKEDELAEPEKEPNEIDNMTTEELREALATEREQTEANLRQWQRAAADYQNLKRRSEQEKGESTRFAQIAIVINLLPVFDDLDRAMATVDASLAGLNWVQGVSAIHRKFAGALQAMDVQEIEADGQPFDPDRHEAMGQAAGEEGKIVHVVEKGYQLGDRVMRPAMVIVGNGEDPGADSDEAE